MKIDPLITETQLRTRIEELAREISRDFGDPAAEGSFPPVAVVLANGAIFFAADLLRRLEFDTEIQVVRVASYVGTESNGAPEIIGNLPEEKIRGRRILVIDDISDTGFTLEKIRNELEKLGAESVRLCVLLDKTSRRRVPEKADYVGFPIEDAFVVGYGLDLNDAWRTLPYIGIVRA